MILVLCRNCYNLLQLNIKVAFSQKSCPVYIRFHRSRLYAVQENSLVAGQYCALLQQSLATSAQAALLLPKQKRKKSGKNIAFLENNADESFIEDRQAFAGIKIQSGTECEGTVSTVNTALFGADISGTDNATNLTTYADNPLEENSEDVTEIHNAPALSVQQKKQHKKLKKVAASTKAKELANTSKKLPIFMRLLSYVDVCLRLGQHELAHNTVMFYVERGQRTSSPELNNIAVFNLLLKYAAGKGEILYTRNLVKWLKSVNIVFNWQSYLFWLESIGKTKFKNDFQRKAELNEVQESMKAQGYLPDELFLRTTPTKDQKEIISRLFETTDPSISLKPLAYPVRYTCKLLQDFDNLERKLSDTTNSFVMSLEELQQLFFLQLSQENEHVIPVKTVQKNFPSDRTRFLREKLEEQEALWRRIVTMSFQSRLHLLKQVAMKQKTMTIYPYLNLFPVETYVDLIIIEIRLLSQTFEYYAFSTATLMKFMGGKLMRLYKILLKQDKVNTMKDVYKQFLKYAIHPELSPSLNSREYWQTTLASNNLEHFQVLEIDSWPPEVLHAIGKFMYDIILKDITININVLSHKKKEILCVPAFFCVTTQAKNKVLHQIQPHRLVCKLYRESGLEDLLFNATLMPMLCPPLPRTNIHCGGFLLAETPFMRIQENSKHYTILKDHTTAQQLYPVFDSLNYVSNTPWLINKPILDLIIDVFNQGGNSNLSVALHPSSLPLPPCFKPDESPETRKIVLKKRVIYKREKNEMYGLWCDTLYKLSIANYFRDRVFWFPHNLDFRGRAYATPPHFNHLGSDLVRGILLFANGKPLGRNGLDWLKIHLINLTGLKKKEPNAARLAYSNEIMSDILDSADQPFTGRGWWKHSEEPWQTLACCKELAKAVRSGNPETYVCHLPVHQDGTCNGLQHYAALGRDLDGAKQVNLCPAERPQDVYSGVATLVEEARAKDASNGVLVAQILEGHIHRKLIKQTVMTVVYGVTRFGARQQILKQLKEDTSFPAEHHWEASIYLVEKTFQSIGKMFHNTSFIQNWLTDCAKQISLIREETVQWVTPLGLPVVQPYLKGFNIGTPNTMKQVNAFPPNFIHSLDSTHMMLTALHCERNGIDFVAVHDCYWTHASSVDAMSKVCREQFVALYSQPILEDLSEFFFNKFSFPESEIRNTGKKCDNNRRQLNKTLCQVPRKGDFHLEDVLHSTYFFN